ncbi:hypothetical protein F5879DRAFT_996235 [Lentinula edodes]|nr:hypothetical protein F5879DRAFT_996235 [Lentinula edodes]
MGKREGGSGERMAVMESQMAQSLANLRALQEANSKSHQMTMMGMGEGPARAGPSRRTAEQRRIIEESEEEEEEEKEGEVEEKEKDGEGEEEETAPTEAQSEKGKERVE